jgi:tRNA-modifying protein YgfZ
MNPTASPSLGPAPLLPPEPAVALLQGVLRLDHLGVIHAQGEDAASFLHGQLTQDVQLLGHEQARLAAFCSAKGRMQATFVLWRQRPDQVWLVCDRERLAPTLKRLSMFVLRAKVKLSDASDTLTLWGAAGEAVPQALRARERWARWDQDGTTWVRLPDAAGVPRALCCTPHGHAAPVAAAALPLALWQWLEVRSGVAPVTGPIVDAFVPQMLNYESLDGVNFQKGCYPGQEVVARSQFRGTLKRRAYLVHGEQPLQVGQEVFHAADAEQPCGTVASAAAHPLQGWTAIVSLQVSAADGQALTVGSPNGPALTLLPLPYPLRDDL